MQSKNLSIVLAAVLGLSTVGFVGCGGGSDSPTVAPAGVFGFQSASYNTTVAEGSTGTIIDVSTVNPTESSVTYALTGAHSADFAIDTNGRVTYIGSNSLSVGLSPYTFTVTASAAGKTDITRDVTIEVVSSSVLPDRIILRTGQTLSYYNAGAVTHIIAPIADDGSYDLIKGIARSYSKPSSSFVIDNATGLEWQDTQLKDPANAGQAELGCSTYGVPGEWRLPTIDELRTLLDYGKVSPDTKIDSLTFSSRTHSQSDRFWTSSQYKDDVNLRWYVDFSTSVIAAYDSAALYTYRCVRVTGEDRFGRGNFVNNNNNNDTVTDTTTDLMWADDASAVREDSDWESVLNECDGSGLAGHQDWRLPNINELASLYMRIGNQAIDHSIFDNIEDDTQFPFNTDIYWSSTTYIDGTNDEALVIYADGNTGGLSKAGAIHTHEYYRCVRDVN